MIRPLRAAGHTIYLPAELGVQGQDDEPHLTTAARLGAVLITINIKHFEPLHRKWASMQQAHPGILLTEELEPGELFRRLDHAARLLTPEAARNQLMHLGSFKTEEEAQNYVISLTP